MLNKKNEVEFFDNLMAVLDQNKASIRDKLCIYDCLHRLLDEEKNIMSEKICDLKISKQAAELINNEEKRKDRMKYFQENFDKILEDEEKKMQTIRDLKNKINDLSKDTNQIEQDFFKLTPEAQIKALKELNNEIKGRPDLQEAMMNRILNFNTATLVKFFLNLLN